MPNRSFKERRKREIEPVLHALEELKAIEGNKTDKKHKALVDAITNIENVVDKANFAPDSAVKLDENALVGALFKLFK